MFHQLQPEQVQALGVSAAYAGFVAVELLRRRFFAAQANREDNRLDVAVTLLMPAIAVSLVLLVCQGLGQQFYPQYRQAWADWPWWTQLAMLLVLDDLTQYFWHRASHTTLMWPFHRAHHSASYMGVRMVYRNNAFYYLFMPGLWLSGALVYLGFGWVYVGYTIVKMTVLFGAHSEARWDEKLYRIRALQPLMWLLERSISTPATHFAHHALTEKDGIGHYTGNYGNLLFFWDVLFGTALITRRYPPEFGLPDDRWHGPERWYVQLFYPLFRSRRVDTVLGGRPQRAPEA